MLGGFTSLSTIRFAFLGLLGVIFGLLMFLGLLLIQAPIQTYFRFYALFVLRDTNDAYDLILGRTYPFVAWAVVREAVLS